MKYRDNMTEEEAKAFLASVQRMEVAYAEAAAFDAAREQTPPEEWCDQAEEERRAGLNRGQP